jgi:hypothetical protein
MKFGMKLTAVISHENYYSQFHLPFVIRYTLSPLIIPNSKFIPNCINEFMDLSNI